MACSGSPEHLPYGECGEASASEKPLGVCRKNFQNYGSLRPFGGVKAVIFQIVSDFDLARARGNRPLAKRSAEKPEKDILKKWQYYIATSMKIPCPQSIKNA